MGMKQKRCPRCRKRRRFDHEESDGRRLPGRPDGWATLEGTLVCNYCFKRAGSLAEQLKPQGPDEVPGWDGP